MIKIQIPEFPMKEFNIERQNGTFMIPEVAAKWAWDKGYSDGYQRAVREFVLDNLKDRIDERIIKSVFGVDDEDEEEVDE